MEKCFLFFLCNCVVASGANIPQEYLKVKEDLIIYKDDNFKVYNGGPIVKSNGRIWWIMPVAFEDEKFMTRAVYEIVFINCSPKDANGLKVFYIEVNDIDVKLKNQLNANYRIFSSLISGNYEGNKRYVVIRKTDVSMVAFPDVYVDELTEHKDKSSKDKDLEKMLSFLKTKYRVQPRVTHVKPSNSLRSVGSPLYPCASKQFAANVDQQIVFASPIKVQCKIKDKLFQLYVTKVFMREDPWKVYYIISKNNNLSLLRKHKIFVRVDSGCVGG
ncbi:MAG: hypothetical protein LBT03_02655, partial [Holosporales bacterium]|nr:hypothetical protein [Holosporales bacterium]